MGMKREAVQRGRAPNSSTSANNSKLLSNCNLNRNENKMNNYVKNSSLIHPNSSYLSEKNNSNMIKSGNLNINKP